MSELIYKNLSLNDISQKNLVDEPLNSYHPDNRKFKKLTSWLKEEGAQI